MTDSLTESDSYGRGRQDKVLPAVYDWDSGDGGRSSLEDMDVTPEQMEEWDRVEQKLQEDEAFHYTCPCCTNRRLEANPRIDTDGDTLHTRTYPVELQEGEDPEDVFSRDQYAVNFDHSDLQEYAENGTIDGYFRRQVACNKHSDTAYLEYVGKGEGRLKSYGLKAVLKP